MSAGSFPDIARVDAVDKVRGKARYAADDTRPGLLHARLAVAPIGRGVLQEIDVSAARAVRGVRLVLTHMDLGEVRSAGFLLAGGYAFQSHQPMTSPDIVHRGQPIAVVVGDTLEAAIEGAERIQATYQTAPFSVTLDAPGRDVIAQADSPLPKPTYNDVVFGDADTEFDRAEVKVDAVFASPPQHQNPMELLSTVAEWQGSRLIVHEATQNAEAIRHGLARQLSLAPEQVEVRSWSVGGGFGQRNSLQSQTVLAAIAARRLGRPVKLVMTRDQMFHGTSFRPASRHRIRLGADRSGRLVAAIHEIEQQTSRHDLFPAQYAEISARLHGIRHFRGREALVRTDVQTPGFMRAPWEHAACLAMEAAVDEVAYAVNVDPVALRLANDVNRDNVTGKPLSSRHLAECLTRGADRFGWSRRSMAPGSMRSPEGALVGLGVAVGAYKASTAPAVARLRVTNDGGVFLHVGVHEMGQGIRTALANVVARHLGVDPAEVTTVLDVTGVVPQHLTAGSWGTATAVPAAGDAAAAMAKALAELDAGQPQRRSPSEVLRAAKRPALEVEVRRKAPGQPDQVFDRLRSGLPSAVGPTYADFVSLSYVAHFVEVHVDPTTCRVRVPRVVSVADCGRVISPRTARSQFHGGIVWGIGATLREASEVDPRYGGFLNADLAEYVVPVNADIGSIEVDFIDKPDPLLSDVGVKGLGEVVMTGVAPAIVNAVFHATGRRVRELPIRFEHLLS